MNKSVAISRDKAAFGGAIMLALAGIAFYWAPAPKHSIASFGAPASERMPTSTDALETSAHLSFGDYFDHSSLPAPVAPAPPPPDPAAELKGYRYVGHAATDGRRKALFEAGGSVYSLSVGDELAGFELISIDAAAAIFKKDELIVQLPLGAPQ